MWADYGPQGRTMRRHFGRFWRLWPVCGVVDEVHHVVFVDGIYLSRKLVILIACTKDHVLGWHVARTERTSAWVALMERIAPPDVLVCDGGSGIKSAVRQTWPTTTIQRCTFHAYSAVKRKTTTRPRTQAGVELYGLARDLLEITTRDQAVAWIGELTAWNTRWKTFLSEGTKLAHGQWVPTHRRLIQARNSLNTLVRDETLFTYLDPTLVVEGDPIPATSNQIEGGINTQLRAQLRIHRGMPLGHQVKMLLWWCYMHLEVPDSPARILATTRTDQEIAAMFTSAAHRADSQSEIQRWGTGVNWTDFHHSQAWHETY